MRKQVIALLLLLIPATARAVEYEIEIDVEDEDDLYELFNSEQISEDTFNALVDLIHRGVDLNTADDEEMYALPGLTLKDVQAIATYRKAAGKIEDAQALVQAGILSEEKLRRIAPFLQIRPTEGSPFAATGKIAGRTLWTSADSRVPATELEGKILTLRNLTLGANLILTRNGVTDVRWDPTREALTAQPPGTRVQLAKVYADWRTPTYEILAGNFRAGFAQRLVFDNTPLVTPNGFYPDEVLYRTTDLTRSCIESAGELGATPCPTADQTYVSPDFRYRDGLLGVAASARQIYVGDGWLQIVGFLSREIHSIYQYEIYDRNLCSDPTHDSDPNCAAPAVYKTQNDLLQPTSRYSFQTLPTMWAEPLGGGNVTYFFGRRAHIGVTGYGAKPDWLVNGTNLDFQEWSKWPYGGAYGAVGADATYGTGSVDTGLEFARSFDSTPTGGGFGIISRSTITWPKNELELALRYYDQNFANPYSGAIAEPDIVDGQRARDEAGARVRFAGRVSPRVELHALGDFWVQPSNGQPKIRLEARGDYHFGAGAFAGLYSRWEDKDLRSGGFGQCFDQPPAETDENGAPIPCSGQRIDFGTVVRVEPLRKLFITGQFQLRFIDDPAYKDGFRNDISAWLIVDYWLTNNVRFYARSHYLNQAIDDPTYLETSLWTYVEATYRAPHDLLLRVRYDNRIFLDDRPSTLARDPNPEHWLRLEVEAKF